MWFDLNGWNGRGMREFLRIGDGILGVRVYKVMTVTLHDSRSTTIQDNELRLFFFPFFDLFYICCPYETLEVVHQSENILFL